MTCFRDFTAPLWEIFAGNLLLLFCSLFYLAWRVVSYRPNSYGGSAGGFYITAAFITGVAAIAFMSGGINSLSQDSKGLQVRFILLGVAALFLFSRKLHPIGMLYYSRRRAMLIGGKNENKVQFNRGHPVFYHFKP